MFLYIPVVILFLASENICNVDGNELFGPYDVHFTKIETCRGPKPKNVTSAMYSIKRKGNISYLSANVTVLETTEVEMFRTSMLYLKNNVKHGAAAWTYRTKNPCNHFLIGPPIAYIFNTTDSCVLKPGNYVTDLDITSPTKRAFGSILYGDYVCKTVAFNRKGNIICLIIDMRIVPAEKNKSPE